MWSSSKARVRCWGLLVVLTVACGGDDDTGADGGGTDAMADATIDSGADGAMPDGGTDGASPDGGATDGGGGVLPGCMAPQHLWELVLSVGSGDAMDAEIKVTASAALPGGAFALGGHTVRGTVDLGDGSTVTGDPPTGFVAVYEADGSLRWKKIGGLGYPVSALATSGDGSTIAALQDSEVYFYAASDGSVQGSWAPSAADASSYAYVRAFAPASGGWLIGGSFAGTVDFGGGDRSTPSTAVEPLAPFVVKLSGTGHAWDWFQAGAGEIDKAEVTSVVERADGTVMAFGNTVGGAMPSFDLGSAGSFGQGAFRVVLSPTGMPTRAENAFGQASVWGAAMLSDTQYVVALSSYQDVPLDDSTTVSIDGMEVGVVAAFDGSHDVLWYRALIPAANNVFLRSLSVGNSLVIAGGTLEEDVTVDGVTLSADGGRRDAFVLGLVVTDGTAQWGRTFSGAGDEAVLTAVVLSDGDILAGGQFGSESTGGTSGPVDFGDGPRNPNGSAGFAVRYGCPGSGM